MLINKAFNTHDLLSDTLFITNASYEQPKHIIETPRIGVDYAEAWVDKPLRFYIQGNVFVSRT